MSTLLVASSGGHLQQLYTLRRRLPVAGETVVWVTYDGPQGRSLLSGEDAVFLPYIGSRDPRGVVAAVPAASRLLRDRKVVEVITTGSQVALSFALPSSVLRIPFHFIESAARHAGPSMTGSLVRRLPGITYYTQYERNASPAGAAYGGSVFDGYCAKRVGVDGALRRAVVALGTFRGYGFRRLLERVMTVLPPEVEVLWQTGDTDVSGLNIDAHREIPSADLSAAMAEADIIVAHAGVGTALASLQVGRMPILVPRRRSRGEHVDDHQLQIAGELSAAGLALTTDADDLSLEQILEAASHRIVDEGGAAFRLRRKP